MFTPIHQSDWPRNEHFHYYRNILRCGYSVTVRLDMTAFLRMLKEAKLKFYPSFLYCVSRVIAALPEMRMGVDAQGNPGCYDVLHPNYTVFHEDDHSFSDLWSLYDPEFSVFYRGITADIETYGEIHRFKPKPNPPENYYCISCVPWLDYTGYSLYVAGDGHPNLFPVITFGKYTEREGLWEMPFSLCISHAAADGYHSSQFITRLQETLNEIALTL